MKKTALHIIPLVILALVFSCDTNDEAEYYGEMDQLFGEGKADSVSVSGLPTSVDDSSTQVWAIKNQWEDTDTAAAREAGIAWGADSGLNWDQKYRKWIESMAQIDSVSGYTTFKLTNPWGKDIPAPVLECAEVAMFLRATFASWYNLPFYMQAVSGGTTVYLGHFGWRTASGRYSNTPNFKTSYKDYSYMSQADIAANGWPQDAALRGRKLYGADDDIQSFLGADARAGAYFDEVFLNKRAGYFLLLLLTNFGSVNLADSSNLYNLKPEAVKEGDVLLERWARRGIGHTLIVKTVNELASGMLEAELASGSMPRRQPKWQDAASSKYTFTAEETGGEGTNYEGDEYAKLGGGIKRWRVAKSDAGRYTNSMMRSDVDYWISSTNYEDIAQRPGTFDEILGQMTPEDERAVLLQRITDTRDHLKDHPASCSARINREAAFTDLYDLFSEHFGMSTSEVDKAYRVLEDYVFAELEYSVSKTCCWNSTTRAMYDIVMLYNKELMESAPEGSCLFPVVFKNTNSSYEPFNGWASDNGRAGDWVDWSEDEPCSQRNVANDTEKDHLWSDFCDVYEEVLANTVYP